MTWKANCEVCVTTGLTIPDRSIVVLAATTTAEQKARLLEVKVEENAETIEHLRHERSLLVAEHKKLQQRFKNASEVSGAHRAPEY